jgi:predicted nuclease of predicted toxin-antitoxin system
MNLLLDTCVWGRAKGELQAFGHDVLWTGDWPQDPGDEDILAQAHREQRVLITLDKDFGELAIVRRLPHCGIVRLVNIRAQQQAAICEQVLRLHGSELAAGAIVTVEAGRVRIRPGENPGSASPGKH